MIQIENIHNLTDTLQQSTENLSTDEGKWCEGCSLECEFKRRGTNIPDATLDFEELISKLYAIVPDTI